MQEEFIINLRKIIEKGEERALLISATGTGKTYASAFAVRELGFKRVLFIVHRAQLAKQAKKSFERVFNNFVSMGIVGDGKHEYDSDFIFTLTSATYAWYGTNNKVERQLSRRAVLHLY